MDSYRINNKNPYKFNFVKKKIIELLKKYTGKFIIIKSLQFLRLFMVEK